MTPRVTITVPTWNRADLLPETLHSLLNQSVQDIEVYVADNGSTDNTAEVVAAIDDPRLHYRRHEENIGLARNETFCLGLGTAPYLSLLHDDDLLLPASLERRIAVLDRHPGVGLVHSAFSIIGSTGQTRTERTTWADAPTDPVEPGHLFIERSMSRGCRVGLATVMMRRDAVRGLAFEERFGTTCDHVLWLRIALHWEMAYLASPEAAIRMHETSQSALGAADFVEGGVYQETFEQTDLMRTMTLQFLAEADGLDRRRMARLAVGRSRQVLADEIRRQTLPDRDPATTWRLLKEAQSHEPTILRSPQSSRLLVSSLVGEPGRRLVRRARRGTAVAGR
jgi:hypothetical protein